MGDTLTTRDRERADTLTIIVKEETPFLPKVAFTLITLASMGGAFFTGRGMGLEPMALGMRWLTLWSLALAGGFLAWRVCYLRAHETDVDDDAIARLNDSALTRADQVARWVAPIVFLGAPGALVVPPAMIDPSLRWGMVIGSVLLAGLLLSGVTRKATAILALAVVTLLLAAWATTDAGTDWHGLVRMLHLTAFSLWLGGALWNIAVAMPAGRAHPNLDAVLAGARQLDRFRWVVRFVLPTIILTGVFMAWGYRVMPMEWWLSYPGVLIPLKVLAIVALVVVFITCPLFRHCSPVQGVCNTDDLSESPPVKVTHR